MIAPAEMQSIAGTYGSDTVHIGVLGSHSALALGMAAKSFGARTLLVAE
jgi:5-formaminoimidazole-4-carboxamide-1-beta-D-ribofuranosyl 5'-monophosphate synthetase